MALLKVSEMSIVVSFASFIERAGHVSR